MADVAWPALAAPTEQAAPARRVVQPVRTGPAATAEVPACSAARGPLAPQARRPVRPALLAVPLVPHAAAPASPAVLAICARAARAARASAVAWPLGLAQAPRLAWPRAALAEPWVCVRKALAEHAGGWAIRAAPAIAVRHPIPCARLLRRRADSPVAWLVVGPLSRAVAPPVVALGRARLGTAARDRLEVPRTPVWSVGTRTNPAAPETCA